ncbi:MAG: class I SAM-dependent methyltransferase [Saprospiraceae bacterium]|nr:class I SAM-dependent methyltransferase [Saprospiraceae bacterium]
MRRIETVKAMMPKTVGSVLDVGCGNGILVNYLSNNHSHEFQRICGCDRSETSLQFVKTEKVKASIDQLPFSDKEFDLVTCLEVIEHLPQEVYIKALKELQRIASKYIIVSVPNDEDLLLNRVTCPKCITAFSPFYHMRNFTSSSLANLFEGSCKVVEVKAIEKVIGPRFPRLKQKISRWIHPELFPSSCICPMCGYNEFDKLKSTQRSPDSKINETVEITGLSKFWPHTYKEKWLVALFEKL